MRTYRVYFEQVNADYIEVEASEKGPAINKAIRQWLEDNTPTRDDEYLWDNIMVVAKPQEGIGKKQ